ncbi:pre-mRNA cleavage complex 2 protein Pcf11 [Bombina bombina]|uniref:pre-mRNA cleavage complex 2 protein Pcf11 n=1 Tax=Bombina bombina TaxID=8345 RepID=UPI00235AD538|nr:pre-mRNA cleavage complex 2 protein Pcf11 [Bombina bombina]
MSEEEAREDARRDYQSSLEDLTFNSKPHINMLTILAEENLQFAKDIVILIEAQIAKAPTTEKLPVMYLMDSIVKNVGRDYLTAFSKNLVPTFVNVFEKVDENTRKSLYKLRSTWDEIFPSKKMFALDVRVNSIDPAWPVKPLPPNVNTASIHVNPKFLNKSEESPAPSIPAPSATPKPPMNSEVQKQLSQEQLIRQQLLVKQKQLLELQAKKLELELEQTKTLLATSINSASVPPKHVIPEVPHIPVKVPHLTTTHPENRIPVPSQPHDLPQIPTRDPRLNRGGQHSPHPKDQTHKKEFKSNQPVQLDCKFSKPVSHEKIDHSTKQEKTGAYSRQEKTNATKLEKVNTSLKQEKLKVTEKELKKDSMQTDLKGKSKSPSPLQIKSLHPKGGETIRDTEVKRDPRLRKHVKDKTEDKEDETKERRKSTEKREDHKSSEHRPTGNRGKMNGAFLRNDTNVADSDKSAPKPGRTGHRKRSRSPKSRSPVHSPKRRERRSPKRRQRSSSPIPSLLKIGKLQQPPRKPSHIDEFSSNLREERNKRNLKADPRDSRRQKRISEERQQEPLVPSFIKSNSEPKENVENWQGTKPSKRWKSGWEENKSPQNDDHHQSNRSPYPRRRDSWPNKGVVSPRTPKQQPWLSVDANLQIPKELTSASKGELLKKANERLTSGEITHDEFLVVAHQICQLFQYQEEKHRCNVWDSPTEENKGLRKKPLLSNAELTYYQHKAKLKRTQVQAPFARGDPLDSEFLDIQLDEMVHSGRDSENERMTDSLSERNEQFPVRMRGLSPLTGTRPQADDLSHESHRRHDEQREIPKGVRDDRRPLFNERFQHARPRYEETEQPNFVENQDSILTDKDTNSQKCGLIEEKRPLLDAPPRVSGNRGDCLGKSYEEPSNISNVREMSPAETCARFDATPVNQVGVQHFEGITGQPNDDHFDVNAEEPVDGSRFDGMSGHQVNLQGQSMGMQRFEETQSQIVAPNHPVPLQRLEGPPGQSMGGQRFEGAQGQQRFEGAQGQQRFEGAQGQQRFEGAQGQQRFEGAQGQQRFEGAQGQQRFEGAQGQQRFEGAQGQQRFEGAQGQQRFEGAQGQQRFEGAQGQQRFEGAQGQQRFEGAQGQQRFEGAQGQQLGPQRFDGAPNQPMGPQRFEGVQPMGPQRFEGSPRPPLLQQRFDGPQCQPIRFEQSMAQPMRFDGIQGQPMGAVRFERPFGPRFEMNQPPRFDGGPCQQPLMRFDGPVGQGGPRFEGTPINRFEGQPPLLPRFDMHPGQPCQRFEGPPGHQTPPRFDGPMQVQPRFDGPMPQRFDGPNQQPRFDIPIGPQGPRFDNVNHPPIRQNAPPYGQTGPYCEPQNLFHGPPQGMQFQRPEPRFDMPQGPNFAGPPGPGMQCFPNQLPRPSVQYFDDKNPQAPQFGNMGNLPVGNVQANQPYPPLGGMTQPASFSQEQQFGPGPNTGVFVQSQQAAPPPFPENHLGQLDVNELFSKLLSTGILKVPQTEASSTRKEATESPAPPVHEEDDDEQSEDQDVPDLTGFVLEDLKHRCDSVINRLYTGIQCYSCGMRFTKSQTDVYADHLDWHYRQNRTEKDVSRKITHRRWYYSLADWIEFEEIADLEERAKSQFFEKVHEEVILKTQEAAKEKEFQSVPAGPAGADEICEICQEQFEQYWDEEEEEWHLKNAMCVNGKIYHPSCYDDYKNTSSFLESTPSPSKTLLENPLSAMLSLVKEEVAEPSVTVKEEPTEPSTCTGEIIPLLTEIKKESDEPV